MPFSTTVDNLAGSNDVRLNPPSSFNLISDVLQPRALATPDRIAIIGVGADGVVERWSYDRVMNSTGRLAGALIDAGIAKGDRVLVFMPRTPLWLIAMAACQHIGAVPVPCVTQISASEVAYRAKQSGALGIISSAELTGRFSDLQEVIPVRIARGAVPGWLDLKTIVDTPRGIPPTAEMPAETPALMYFTSGSSGLPKAVVHAARGVFVRCWQPWVQLATDSNDVIWTTSDTGWTRAASCMLFGAWMNGATSLIVEGNLSATEKVEMLVRHGVTLYSAVATELRQIIADAEPRALPKLRYTISAGEAMTAELSEHWTAFSGSPLVVGYGQTETATSTLTDPTGKGVNGMIGQPLEGNDITILIGNEKADSGVHGEIAFAGSNPGLMLGYWKDNKLVPAFSRDGWHMTGDSGYLDEKGNLFFVGRSDDIISSSGYRIGPTEVENALMRHTAVQECAVTSSPDPKRGEVVKAYVILRPTESASDQLVRDLQDFVKREIAPYKYPRQIEFVNDLPRTPTGKVSRRALREGKASSNA